VVDVTAQEGPVIAMWAHPRAVSTAFLRMMIARGDVTVVHEPLVTLADNGAIEVPGLSGGTVRMDSAAGLLRHLTELAAQGPVFFKDTLEYRHQVLYDEPELIAAYRHTFIVREPARAIASHHALKPDLSCSDVGYEHQYDLFRLAWDVTGSRPVVITAERLLAEPAAVVSAYCEAVGLEFRPDALSWRPEDRPEWRASRRWHLDAIESSGFQSPERSYEVTVDNDDRLRSYYEHHKPFYDRMVEHAL
jgi:hypothetical protein